MNDGSIQAINKCEKYKIKIEIAFGEYYQKLKDNSGQRTDLVTLGNEVTPKQQAGIDLNKSGKTINKYA